MQSEKSSLTWRMSKDHSYVEGHLSKKVNTWKWGGREGGCYETGIYLKLKTIYSHLYPYNEGSRKG